MTSDLSGQPVQEEAKRKEGRMHKTQSDRSSEIYTHLLDFIASYFIVEKVEGEEKE